MLARLQEEEANPKDGKKGLQKVLTGGFRECKLKPGHKSKSSCTNLSTRYSDPPILSKNTISITETENVYISDLMRKDTANVRIGARSGTEMRSGEGEKWNEIRYTSSYKFILERLDSTHHLHSDTGVQRNRTRASGRKSTPCPGDSALNLHYYCIQSET